MESPPAASRLTRADALSTILVTHAAIAGLFGTAALIESAPSSAILRYISHRLPLPPALLAALRAFVDP
jgi:hypothetical protein